jgi:hypothetical protein
MAMSDNDPMMESKHHRIQRWEIAGIVESIDPDPEGEFVTYSDHVAAVAEAVFQRGVDDADLYGEAIKAAVAQGQRDERERIRKAVEALIGQSNPSDGPVLMYASGVLAIIDGLPAEQDHQQDDDEQDRVDDQQNVVIHTPESHRSGEKGSP